MVAATMIIGITAFIMFKICDIRLSTVAVTAANANNGVTANTLAVIFANVFLFI